MLRVGVRTQADRDLMQRMGVSSESEFAVERRIQQPVRLCTEHAVILRILLALLDAEAGKQI